MILVGNNFWEMSKAGSMQDNAASYEPEINQKDGEGDGGHTEKDKSLTEMIKEKLREKLEEILEETLKEKGENDEKDKSLKEVIEEKLKKKLEEMLEKKEEKEEKDKRLEEVIEEKLEEKEKKEEKDKSLEDAIEEKLEEKLSVDVDVTRRGPILWISTGAQLECLLSTHDLSRGEEEVWSCVRLPRRLLLLLRYHHLSKLTLKSKYTFAVFFCSV